jgi:hypothetical protein
MELLIFIFKIADKNNNSPKNFTLCKGLKGVKLYRAIVKNIKL